jgi:hypothetical protein
VILEISSTIMRLNFMAGKPQREKFLPARGDVHGNYFL